MKLNASIVSVSAAFFSENSGKSFKLKMLRGLLNYYY